MGEGIGIDTSSGDALTANILRLGKKVFNMVKFERILCNAASNTVDPNGTHR